MDVVNLSLSLSYWMPRASQEWVHSKTTLEQQEQSSSWSSRLEECQSGNRHLRRIIAQFCTGSHWLNIETGRHKNLERTDRTCPMCSHRIVSHGLAPELTALILMMKAVTLLRMSIMPSLSAQAMPMPMSFFQTFSSAMSAQSAIF